MTVGRTGCAVLRQQQTRKYKEPMWKWFKVQQDLKDDCGKNWLRCASPTTNKIIQRTNVEVVQQCRTMARGPRRNGRTQTQWLGYASTRPCCVNDLAAPASYCSDAKCRGKTAPDRASASAGGYAAMPTPLRYGASGRRQLECVPTTGARFQSAIFSKISTD
jgi:hypothetical protein